MELLEWELIGDNSTYRMKVFGGWLVKSVIQYAYQRFGPAGMVFIPDPYHEWNINNPSKGAGPRMPEIE